MASESEVQPTEEELERSEAVQAAIARENNIFQQQTIAHWQNRSVELSMALEASMKEASEKQALIDRYVEKYGDITKAKQPQDRRPAKKAPAKKAPAKKAAAAPTPKENEK